FSLASDPKVAQAVAEAEAVARKPVSPEVTSRVARELSYETPTDPTAGDAAGQTRSPSPSE
ncbi:SPFH/Band 7/PHB domain protein, partial [Streptomyces sp. SID10244]|nr:SPFH/Band 7/PHB domain protein [Streptomyces sp. SID10244]